MALKSPTTTMGLWVLLAIIWSSSYGVIKIGIQSMGPMTLVSGRMMIGSCVLLFVLKAGAHSLPTRPSSWASFFIAGMLGSAIPFALISYGEGHVDSGLAAILMGIAPVVTVLLAPLIIADERLNRYSVTGVALGILGLVVLVGSSALLGIGEHLRGQLAILAAALCYALTTLYVRRYVTLPATVMAAGSTLVGAFMISTLALIFEDPLTMATVDASAIIAVIYLGIFPTALATTLYFHLVPVLGASRMSQINFIVPVLGALLGVVFLAETLRPSTLLALAIILMAIYLVIRPQRETG
jgi:drug/metabolite transporter (DMT)-like permease